jgi:hypothetical protein
MIGFVSEAIRNGVPRNIGALPSSASRPIVSTATAPPCART